MTTGADNNDIPVRISLVRVLQMSIGVSYGVLPVLCMAFVYCIFAQGKAAQSTEALRSLVVVTTVVVLVGVIVYHRTIDWVVAAFLCCMATVALFIGFIVK